jgi:hypothetical protein
VRRERVERRTLRFIGLSFLALAIYVACDALDSLVTGTKPHESTVGIVIAAASLIVMPLLARSKRRLALALSSGALVAEAKQTEICAYLSAILLGGLALNAGLGWWWADPPEWTCPGRELDTAQQGYGNLRARQRGPLEFVRLSRTGSTNNTTRFPR